jgi:hypothetical protein
VSISPASIRISLRWLALVGFVLFVIVMRVVTSARSELIEADAAAQRGAVDEAIVHYRRAARWYAPGSPYHVRALQRLAELGRDAEHKGDSEGALMAYRSLRGAILATRSFYVPEPARLEAADRRIASLMSELPPPGMDAGKSREQLRREHLALLEVIPGPKIAWTFVLLFGFACWIGAAFAFSVRAIDEHDRWVGVEVRRWGALILAGFGLFGWGMTLA